MQDLLPCARVGREEDEGELPTIQRIVFKKDAIELLPDDPTKEPIIIKLKDGFDIEGLEIKPK